MNAPRASRAAAAARPRAPTRRTPPPPPAALRWPWLPAKTEADPRLEAAFFDALKKSGAAPSARSTASTSVDAAVAALIAAGASSSGAPPSLDPSPWAVAHTSGLLGWRAFAGRRALASQAIDTATGSVLSRAEALGGRLLSTAAGSCAPRSGEPRTLDVSVTRVEVGAGPRAGGPEDGAGRQVGSSGGGKEGWALRLPVKGTGAVEVLYAGRDVRVFRGTGGVAVQVRPELLEG